MSLKSCYFLFAALAFFHLVPPLASANADWKQRVIDILAPYRTAGRTLIQHGGEVYLDLFAPDRFDFFAEALAFEEEVSKVRERLWTEYAFYSGIVQLLPYLPSYARLRTDTYIEAHEDGLDCFNALLNFHDPTFGGRLLSRQEMALELSLRYDRIPQGGAINLGNAVAFHDGPEIIHTAVFLDDSLLWHKPGGGRSAAWGYDEFSATLELYSKEAKAPLEVTFHRFKGNRRRNLLGGQR